MEQPNKTRMLLSALLLWITICLLPQPSLGEKMLTLTEIAKCRKGFGGYPDFMTTVIEECRVFISGSPEHNSDACYSLCLWQKFNYFKMENDKAVGYQKENIDRISKGMYAVPESVEGKTNDFIICFDQTTPRPSFQYNGKCEDLKGFNDCYTERLKNACK